MTTVKKPLNKKKLIIFIIAALLIAALVIFLVIRAQQQTKAKSSTSSVSVSNVTVTAMDLTKTLSGSGSVNAAVEEQLSLRTKYYLKEVLVDVGSYVTSGTKILSYTNGKYFTAPYNGVVTAINVPDAGSVITNSHYIKMSATDTLTVNLSISESDINTVSLGQEVTVSISALNASYTGYITYISEIGSYSSSGSTFTATATFANDGQVKIGMSATCSVILQSVSQAICVPTEAVMTNGNEKYVVVVKDDGTTENVTVTTGISNDAYIQIITGLAVGQTVQMTTTSSSSSSNAFGGGGQGGGFGGDSMPSGGGSSMPSGDMPSGSGSRGQSN